MSFNKRPWFYLAMALWTRVGFEAQLAAESYRFENQTLTVPEGYLIELVSDPKLVSRPIVADFDEQGRLYVADSSGSNEKVQTQLETRPHRIVRLEDKNSDGIFDSSVVYADRMMFPEGAMWHAGSLYVAAPPSIWKLTDTDGDGIADKREEWFQGKTLTGCANDLHGPYMGRDGWIYWAKGAFAEQKHEVQGGKELISRAAHLFRARPDGSGIETVMTGGMDNPVEIAFTFSGERIFTTTFFQHPGGGKRDGLIHAIYGGVYGKDHDVLQGHKRTGDLMPVLTHFGAGAPSGLMHYESSLLGGDYTGNLFSAQFNLARVQRHILSPSGSTYTSRDVDFVTSDNPDFHPTDVLEDADGSILVVDTGGWYKLCCPTSQLSKPDVLGAIYRIRPKSRKAFSDPLGRNLKWDRMDLRTLEALIDDPRPVVQRLATRKLAEIVDASRTNELFTPLREWLRTLSARGRRNLIWSMTGSTNEVARQIVQVAMNNQDESTAIAAIHSASVNRDKGAYSILISRVNNGTHAIRRASAEALGRIGNARAIPHLLRAAARPLDRQLEHSIAFSLIEINEPTATAQGLLSTNAAVVKIALTALDQMDSKTLKPEQVLPLLQSRSEDIQQTASWIVSNHPEWAPEAVNHLQKEFNQPIINETQQKVLKNIVTSLIQSPQVQGMISTLLKDSGRPKESQSFLLRLLTGISLKETPADWLVSLGDAIMRSTPESLPNILGAIKSIPHPKTPPQNYVAALRQVSGNANLPAPIRIDALNAVTGPGAPLNDIEFELIGSNIAPAVPVNIRATATAILSRAHLSPSQQTRLITLIPSLGPLEVSAVLTAFENLSDLDQCQKLYNALTGAKTLGGIPPDTLRKRTSKMPPAIRQQIEELIGKIHKDVHQQRERLESLLNDLKTTRGDVRRGQSIFNSPKAACSACHAIGYRGGKLGPDLTTIGQVRTERDLLESILYPSASFVRSYESFIIQTKAGDEISGILKRDTSDEIILATGPETEIRLARPDVEEMRPGTVSVMPQGLEEQMNRQELADLLAFLKNTKWGTQ